MSFNTMYLPTPDTFRTAIREYQVMRYRYRKSCEDKPLFKEECDITDGYKYIHWTANDALAFPDKALSQILRYYALAPLASLIADGVKGGDVLLRVVEYKEQKDFGTHLDISYSSLNIATIKDDLVTLNLDSYYGTQAQLIHGYSNDKYKPLYHKFNAHRGDFSFILFVNAHFSTPIDHPVYKTVGEYLQNIYYS